MIPNRSCQVNLAKETGDCPIFKNVAFEDIRVAGANRCGDLDGFKGALLQGLTFRNVTFATPPPVGWSCGYVETGSMSAVDEDKPRY